MMYRVRIIPGGGDESEDVFSNRAVDNYCCSSTVRIKNGYAQMRISIPHAKNANAEAG